MHNVLRSFKFNEVSNIIKKPASRSLTLHYQLTRKLQAFDKHTSLMITDVPSHTADLTDLQCNASGRHCIAAVLCTTIWEVIVDLHVVQDVMI